MIAIHRDDPESFVGIEREQMGIVRDQVVSSGGKSRAKDGAIRRVLRYDVTGRSRLHKLGPTYDSPAGQIRQATRKAELFRQDALEFVEQVVTGVDPPGCTLGRFEQLFRNLAEDGFCDVDIRVGKPS